MAQEKDKTLFLHPPVPTEPLPHREITKTRDGRDRTNEDEPADWIDAFEEAIEREETLELEFLTHLEDHQRTQGQVERAQVKRGREALERLRRRAARRRLTRTSTKENDREH